MFKIFEFFKKLFTREIEEILYICNGTNTLPEKLSSEAEQIVLEKISMGDENAKSELIEKNLRLVVYTAQKFENTGVNIEDAISVGTIGLIKATRTFNIEKNIKFATYASRCIENEILMHLRKISKIKSEISLDEPLSTDKDGNELIIADVLSFDEDCVQKKIEKQEECEFLVDAVERLSAREKLIMKLRFGMIDEIELTQKEVADKLNISQSYISRLEKKILLKLRKDILEQDAL